MSNLTPVQIDADERANRKAIETVFGAFQTDQPAVKQPRRIVSSTITKTKTQPMNETQTPAINRDVLSRELRSHDVSIHDELRLNSTDRIIDAALSTVSHMARVMVETDLSPITNKPDQLISFHAAAENPTIPAGADYLRTAIDPTNTISRVHLYSRADSGEGGVNPDSDPVLDRPAII